MTGRLGLGKMSTGIRVSARIEDRAMLMTATRMVIGRRIAALMSHMLSSPACRPLQLLQKRLEIALHLCGDQHRPPYADSGNGIIGLGLCEQPLRFSNLDDRRQAQLVSFPRLGFRLCSRLELNRRSVWSYRACSAASLPASIRRRARIAKMSNTGKVTDTPTAQLGVSGSRPLPPPSRSPLTRAPVPRPKIAACRLTRGK